jgi:hypothetical protein
MTEVQFVDEVMTAPDLHRCNSIFKDEEEILGPKKNREYPHPFSPSGNEGQTCNKEGGECLKSKN